MGKRARKRARDAGGGGAPAPATTTDYRDADGNVLTLRDELSAGTLRKLRDLDARPGSSAEDRWQRRMELLFERLAVRWEMPACRSRARRSCSAASGWRVRRSAAGCAKRSTSTCAAITRMPEPLTVAAAQPPCTPYDVAANALAHAAVIRSAAARVVIFPELSITGYKLDAEPVDPGDPHLEPLVDACVEAGSLALFGAPAAGAAGRPHIAMLAADGSGVSVAYRKMWLGGAEPERFAPGEAPATLEVAGWRLGLAICRGPDGAAIARAGAEPGELARTLG